MSAPIVDNRPAGGQTGESPGRDARESPDRTPGWGTRGSGLPAAATWRSARLPVAIGLLVAVGVALLGIANNRFDRGAMDPKSVEPAGARALAVLLGDRGVSVHRVKGLSSVLARAGSGSTVFLPFPDREPTRLLSRLAARPTTVVLVAPSSETLGRLTAQASLTGPATVERRDPGCSDPVATTAGDADLGGGRYTMRGSNAGSSCYAGSLVTVRGRAGQPVVVAGVPDPFTNARLGERGNAALALGLLGGQPDLWWVLPDPAAGDTGPHRSLMSVLPGWVRPVLWELALAALLAALWRGRRLGPVITESLPVVVRAAESVEGRGRLYLRARARDRAAEALRSSAQARLMRYLGLSPGGGSGADPAPAALFAAVAAQTAQPAEEIRALLLGPVPADDAGLVRLAGALDQLVASTLDPGVHRR